MAERRRAAKLRRKPAAAKKRGSRRKTTRTTGRPLYLTEDDVCGLVTVKDAVAALESMFATWGDPATQNLARQRATPQGGTFNLMGAAWGTRARFGLKAYYAGANGARFHVLLYSAPEGRLEAIIEADHLGRMRTGAASGVATRLLAKPEARTLGVIGAGRQAFTQIAAICAVRDIALVRVFSPTVERRTAMASRIERELNVAAHAAASAEAAVSDADVIVTITQAAEPVLRANWLKSGVHINAAGANAATRREIDAETVLRSTVRATDQVAQARSEAGEYRDLVAAGRLSWNDIVELGDIATGRALGRRGPADITFFKSLGIGLEDIALADLIMRRAREHGLRRPL